MATSLSASIAASLDALFANSLDVGSIGYPVKFSPNYIFTDGTGANQAKRVFTDTRTIAASANEDLDLAGGLNDAFGAALTFTKIKALIVKADAANVNDVVVGGAASAQVASIFGNVADNINVKPGGLLMLVAPDVNGYAITATSADLLRIANSGSGSSVTYTIVIVGVV